MSSSNKVALQPAYVLHTRAYRDTSLLIEVFTPEYGRVGLIARGARSAKSRVRGVLQPFRSLLVSWTGRGELQTLAAVEEAGRAPRLPGDRLIAGFYLNELIMRMIQRGDPHMRLFAAYSDALTAMEAPNQLERTLRMFEKRLLDDLGYQLLLDREAGGGAPVDAGRRYSFLIERGPVGEAAGEHGGVSVGGASLLSLHHEDLTDEASLADAKRLMRAVLSWYLGSRPLKSRELIFGRS
jgi:DNA repair protein RecO (recombination protein O)